MGGVPSGLAPGPGAGLTVRPGPREPHEDRCELQEAQIPIWARQAPLPATPARRREVERKSPTSLVTPLAHSNVSKPFGKTACTATLKPRPRFPERYLPTQLAVSFHIQR